MCGIAGLFAEDGQKPVPRPALVAMARALVHRGPDEEGFLIRPGVGLASRRLSIVDLADGQQPVANEERDVFAVFNGELFDHHDLRRMLKARGHRLRTRCDTEVIPHLWEEFGEGMFERLRGQFALALWDAGQRRLALARDRFGIAPLYWARRDGWLLFASEVKALLASGLVKARADVRGLDQAFTFFAMPGPATCFAGVSALLPAHYLEARAGGAESPARVSVRRYWEMDFPDRGAERDGDGHALADGLEEILLRAVERRLRADVPVVTYLSGGVDSGLVAALAAHLRGEPLPAFTIRIPEKGLDETDAARQIARHIGLDEPIVTECGRSRLLATYPRLVRAAEAPVLDASCAAVLLQAQTVRRQGYKVALTGEGADEWLAGYPWLKATRALSVLDFLPGVSLSRLGRWALIKLLGSEGFDWTKATDIERQAGGHNAWLDVYGIMSLMKTRLYSRGSLDRLGDASPYDGMELNAERVRRWHPLHRSLYLGARVLLPGLLLQAKGDRAAMHSSVETRYPFLDEEVFDYLAPLHPRWKLRGLTGDKRLLRLVAQRWLPKDVAWRSKVVFRAASESLYPVDAPPFVRQLLSEEALRRTGYFDPTTVARWLAAAREGKLGLLRGLFIKMGLAGVFSTQLWHQLYIDSSLAELPGATPAAARTARPRPELVAS